MMKLIETAERLSEKELSNNYLFQRLMLAYVEAAKIISGHVLEIGTGNGYGIETIAPSTDRFVTVDKYKPTIIKDRPMMDKYGVEFAQMTVPPFHGIPDGIFDFVFSFQVIEHIQDDAYFVEEVHRVLKDGGQFLVTTPNKKMSLTRNPWHVREYTVGELGTLLGTYFQSVEKRGVFGHEKAMAYYYKNKASVSHITRFDIFDLQHRLPAWMLQIPYDILNRINRKKLLKNHSELVSNICMSDYYIGEASDASFDLFYLAKKGG